MDLALKRRGMGERAHHTKSDRVEQEKATSIQLLKIEVGRVHIKIETTRIEPTRARAMAAPMRITIAPMSQQG